jgi:hypothetical protein
MRHLQLRNREPQPNKGLERFEPFGERDAALRPLNPSIRNQYTHNAAMASPGEFSEQATEA